MLEGLTKPVIFTGSQLPIGVPRTDGKENLISAVEIAAAKDEKGHARVPEVAICFDSQLLRGNRCVKYSAEAFNALGQRIASVKGGGERLTIDLSGQPAGIYFVNVTDSVGRKCVKKVVKH